MIEFSGQLKDVQAQLDSRFYRCHRSYIVNKHNIKEIDFKQSIVYMTNGETCLLSVRMKKGPFYMLHFYINPELFMTIES